MKSVLLRFCATLALALLVAPGAKAAAIYRGFGGVVRISGEIKVGDYEELKKQLAARPQAELSVRSQGGDILEAIRMAELIHANGSALTVRDYCLSACASYLLPAARTRTIPDGAVVAFHAGTEGALRAGLGALLARLPHSDADAVAYWGGLVKLETELEDIVRAGRRAHAAFGVAPWLHDAVLLLTAPDHVGTRVDHTTRKVVIDDKPEGACNSWVPDAAGLAEVGIKVTMSSAALDRDAVAKTLKVPKERIYFGRLSEMKSGEVTGSSCAAGVALPVDPLAATSARPAAAPLLGHPVLGHWRIDLPQLNCAEDFEINADGGSRSRSAGERLETRVQLSQTLSPQGFYRWIGGAVRGNGEPDCSGNRAQLGVTHLWFVRLRSEGQTLQFCTAEAEASCVVEYQRVPE